MQHLIGKVNEYVLTESPAHKERTVICQMVEHFPEVFVDKMPVDARSMTNACCILAMENAMVQLSTFYPNLNIHHNATRRDLRLSGPTAQPTTGLASAVTENH